MRACCDCCDTIFKTINFEKLFLVGHDVVSPRKVTIMKGREYNMAQTQASTMGELLTSQVTYLRIDKLYII